MMQQVFDFFGRAEVMAIGLAAAVFLTLFWVVRGAPLGQRTHAEPGEAPSSSYRDRVVALAIASFLIILGGAFVAARYGIPWSVPVFAAGFVMILAVLAVNRRYRHVSPTLRRVVEFSNAALNVSLIGGILIVANVFAFRFGGKPLDFTHDEAFTLSSLSVNQVEGLKQPLRFTLVMGRDPRMIRQRDRVHQLIDLYRSVNPSMVTVDEIIAFSQDQAADYAALVTRVPELPVVRGDAVVVELGEGESARRGVLGVQDMFRDASTNTAGDDPRYATAFSGEDLITSTLVRFREGKKVQVGFTTGHGEPMLAEMDPNRVGLGLWKTRLASLGTEAVEVNLLAEDVPAATAVLVVVAPKGRFQDQEIARIKGYLAKGGPLLVVANGFDKTGIEEILALHNVEYEPGIVVDPVFSARARITSVFTPPLPQSENPIVESLAGQNLLFPEASPLRVIGSGVPGQDVQKSKVNPAVMVLPFLKTGPQSWSESDRQSPRPQFDKASDKMGPITVGMAASERAETAGGKPRPRLVAFSSGLMAANPVLASDPANTDLLNNAIGWLRGKSETIGMAPKVHTAMLFTADPNLRVRLLLVPTVISVVLIVGFGLTTYLARRS